MFRFIIPVIAAMLFVTPVCADDNFPFRDGLGGLKTRASKNFGANVFGDQVVPTDQYGAPYTATHPLPVVSQLGAPTLANASGTVVTGGTFQQILAQSDTRKGCLIQNPVAATEPLYVNFVKSGVTPLLGNSVQLTAGAAVSCVVGNLVITDEVRIMAASTGHSFIVYAQ